MAVKKIFQVLARACFPRFCLSCKKEGRLLCEDCIANYQSSIFDRVDRFNVVDETTPKAHIFNFMYADPIIRGLICAWKYEYDQTAWNILKRLLSPRLTRIKQIVEEERIQVIVPLCLHNQKENLRGFDQSVEIARFLENQLKIDYIYLIEKIEETGKQAEKNDKERVLSMKKSPFKIVSAMFVPKNILLVDDVWTTGATAGAAIKTLKSAGAENIWVYTLAKGR